METAGHIPSGNPSHCKLGYLLQTTKPQQHTSDGIFGDELTFTYTHQNKEGEKKDFRLFCGNCAFWKELRNCSEAQNANLPTPQCHTKSPPSG